MHQKKKFSLVPLRSCVHRTEIWQGIHYKEELLSGFSVMPLVLVTVWFLHQTDLVQ